MKNGRAAGNIKPIQYSSSYSLNSPSYFHRQEIRCVSSSANRSKQRNNTTALRLPVFLQ